MLTQMRNATKSWWVYGSIGLLIVVFTFFFQGSEGLQPTDRRKIATVDGSDVYNTDMTVLMNRVSRRQSRDDDEQYKLEKQVVEKYTLLYHVAGMAEAVGFRVSDDELVAFILDKERNLDFQSYSDDDDKYDKELADRFVKFGLNVSADDYYEFKRRELLAMKYLSALEETVTVLPAEVEAQYTLRNDKIELEFARFDPKAPDLAKFITFTDEEVATFAAESGDKVKKYFEDNQKQFSKPKRARVRRIMVRKPGSSADEAATKAADEKWATAKKRAIDDKEDFVAVVADLSEDIAFKDKGGDMGRSELDNMNQDMAKIVDTMKVGDVREYSSSFANFLLKLEEVEEAVVPALEDKQLEIARKILTEEAGSKRVDELAGGLLAAAQKDPTKSLEDIIKGLQPAKPVKEEAPKDDDTPTEPEDGDDTPDDDTAEPTSPWEVLRASATGKFSKYPRPTYSFDPETKQPKLALKPWYDLPRLGADKELAFAIWNLTAENPVYTKIHVSEGASFVIRLKEREAPKAEDADKEREAVESTLRREALASYLGRWQTIWYRPDAELKTESPWLYEIAEKAKASGAIVIIQGAFEPPEAATPAVEVTSPPADPAPTE